jgi:predicted DCC family thiol-disulfide oxidoreductase YuxK
MQQSKQVAIYYDQKCSFCRRSVELITRYFFVQTSHLGPAQADAEIFKIMQTYDSWVVKNSAGETFTTFNAGVEIARHSPLLKWLVPLSKPRFMQRFGEWTYRKIASNRSRIWLP